MKRILTRSLSAAAMLIASGAVAAPPSPLELVEPIAKYKTWVIGEVDQFVEHTRQFTEAVKAGDLKKAMAVQAVITPLKDAVYGGGEPTGEAHARMKAGMVLAGVIANGTVRPPTQPPNAREMDALRAAVAQAGLAPR